MRIVIDMQGAQTGSRFRGIGRYAVSLAKAMINHGSEHEIMLVLNGLFAETIEPVKLIFAGLLPPENIRVWRAPGPVAMRNPKNTWRRKAAERIRESFLSSLAPDFIVLTTLFEGFGDDFVGSVNILDQNTPVAIIMYDLIPLIHKDIYLDDPNVLAWYQNKVSHCQCAKLLLSISESSKQEAIEYLSFQEEAVVNISAATSDNFRQLQIPPDKQREIREKFGLSKDFIMYSGATDPRKNHLRLIDAYSQLPRSVRSQHQLAFVGGLPDDHRKHFFNHAAKCGLSRNELVISGQVDDSELVILYNLCKVFVFPSWHEGFGLPALEAMSCGRAVIVSDASSLPEVVGRSDVLFDPYDEQSIAAKLEQVLTDDVFRLELEHHSLVQSKKFSWEISAKSALAAIESYQEQLVVPAKEIVINANYDNSQTVLIESIAKLSCSCREQDLVSVADAISQNQPQLLVDISELVQHDFQTGIQRVTRSILRELLLNPPVGWRVEPVYSGGKGNYHYASRFSQKLFGSRNLDVEDNPIQFSSGDIFLGLDLLHPEIASSNRVFYRSLPKLGVKVYFVVYDILPIMFPEYANDGVTAGHCRWLEIVTESDGVVCISRAVADEVTAWLKKNDAEKCDSCSVSWFHLGADMENSIPSLGMPEDAFQTIEIISSRPSFLMVGTIEPRKYYAQALMAFEQLWSDGIDVNLVIVGKQGWKVDELIEKLNHHPESGKRLIWLDGISDEYLETVYSKSTCLIAASEGEGFGLPLIEAAQRQLPIIARDIPVFREVANEYAFYFNGKSPSHLVSALTDWIKLYKTKQHPDSGLMSYLTWKQSTSQLLTSLGINTLEQLDD